MDIFTRFIHSKMIFVHCISKISVHSTTFHMNETDNRFQTRIFR